MMTVEPDGRRFHVYKDDEQWLPFFKWFWIKPDETGMGHGAYPSRLIAWIAGWWGTR